MDPPTLDGVGGVTTTSRNPRTSRHAHVTENTYGRTYTCILHRPQALRRRETHTAEGMKTAVVYTGRDTISSSRRRWRCDGGCTRVTADSFTGIVARRDPSPPRLWAPRAPTLWSEHPAFPFYPRVSTPCDTSLQSLRISKHSACGCFQLIHVWFGYLNILIEK